MSQEILKEKLEEGEFEKRVLREGLVNWFCNDLVILFGNYSISKYAPNYHKELHEKTFTLDVKDEKEIEENFKIIDRDKQQAIFNFKEDICNNLENKIYELGFQPELKSNLFNFNKETNEFNNDELEVNISAYYKKLYFENMFKLRQEYDEENKNSVFILELDNDQNIKLYSKIKNNLDLINEIPITLKSKVKFDLKEFCLSRYNKNDNFIINELVIKLNEDQSKIIIRV